MKLRNKKTGEIVDYMSFRYGGSQILSEEGEYE